MTVQRAVLLLLSLNATVSLAANNLFNRNCVEFLPYNRAPGFNHFGEIEARY